MDDRGISRRPPVVAPAPPPAAVSVRPLAPIEALPVERLPPPEAVDPGGAPSRPDAAYPRSTQAEPVPPGSRTGLREPAPGNPAVVALLDRAEQDARAGNLDQSAAGLERALRIEPANPWLWHRLAKLRLGQGDLDQAASLAAKSNSLAPGNRALQAENWRVIADARQRAGQTEAARAAAERARELGP